MLPPLSKYIEDSLKGIRPEYKDENIIWAIQDYYSAKGEFHSDDLKTIYEYDLCAGDFVCDEDTPEEVVKCTCCGYQTDVEGDVMKAEGRCPQCGHNTVVVYERR